MRTISRRTRSRWSWRLAFLWVACTLAACSGAPVVDSQRGSPTPGVDLTRVFAEALLAATNSLPSSTPTPASSLTPTITPSRTATPTQVRTPPDLPGVFTSTILDSAVIPQTYIENTCQYLKARWDPNNSPPGTVVMIIMYHSITEDSNALFPDGSQVHHSDLVQTLEHAHEVGFETINAEQLADFLETNALIPRRSLLIIVDDRKRKEYYETHFVPFLKDYDWKITNAWISAPDTPEYLLQENREIQAQGWVDVQAHGVIHNIPIGEYSSDDFIRKELTGSIEAIEKNFGAHPVGFIWPGGGFTQRAAELAREAGYRLGFTTNPRGPVMFNWIPGAAQVDPGHTYWLPEIPVEDPLMVLPRYWSMDAAYRIDDVSNIGEQAALDGLKNRETELAYYDIVCKKITGEIPAWKP